MSSSIFLAGILRFESQARFLEGLEALRSEESYSPDSSLVQAFTEAMVSDTVMVLRHHAQAGAQFFDRLMGEAYLLTEFAGRGYLVGVARGAKPRVQVAMAAMRYAAEPPFALQADPDPAADYLPRLANCKLTYRYTSEGQVAEVAWTARSTTFGRHHYLSFPHEGSELHFNDWWDGQFFLKAGHQLYCLTADGDEATLRDPADEEIQLILDGQAGPGSVWLSYVPGTENFRLYTHEGYEEVETPLGRFDRCMKVRVDLYFLPTEEERYEAEESDRVFKRVTTTHYFAKGKGLVRLRFQDGELELLRIEEGAAPRPAEAAEAPAPPSPSPGNGGERTKARKPWWKLW